MDSQSAHMIARRPSPRSILLLPLTLALLAGAPIAHAQTTACMPNGVEHCPVKIVNASGAFTADQFQVLAVAQRVDKACQGQTAADLICPPAYVQFDAMGVGTLVPVTAGMTSLPYAKRLSDFPVVAGTSDAYVLKMPRHGSGRIYITLGESITTTVIGTAPPLTVSDPSLGSSTDPNYYKIYDKFESSFLPYTQDDPQERNPLYINTTSVDSLSIPLSLTLSGSPLPEKPGPVGYLRSRSEVFSVLDAGLKDGVTGEWEKLIQKYAGTTLRVIAPNKSLKDLGAGGNDPCTEPGADPCFDRDYFKSHIKAVWDHYNHGNAANAGNTITIVATEVLSNAERTAATPRTLRYTGFVTDGQCPIETTQPQTDSCGDYLARRNQGVTSMAGTFCFKRDPLDTVPHVPPQPEYIPVAMPTTDDMISGAGALCPPNATARSIIARDLNAMLNRGLLPIPGAITVEDGDKSPSGFWATQTPNYYRPPPTGQRQTSNLYANLLHGLSTGGVYAFAFDDVGGSDSTLVDVNADAAILTIQDMSGTTIPDPTARDTARYSGNIVLPGGDAFPNQSVKYNGKVLAAGSNEPFDNVSSPLDLVWVVGGNEYPLAIHFLSKFISPAPLGNRSYNIALSAPPGGVGRWSIAFPGGPGPSPWPSGNLPKLTLDARSTGRLDSVVLVSDVVGNEYANVVADWYLWVKNADNSLYYYDSANWVAASGDDGVKPFQTFGLPSASQPNGDVKIPKGILGAGPSRIFFGVNTTRNYHMKDSGALFQVSTVYPQ